MCQTQGEQECFASRLGFRVGLTIAFGILVTATICNIQVNVLLSCQDLIDIGAIADDFGGQTLISQFAT